MRRRDSPAECPWCHRLFHCTGQRFQCPCNNYAKEGNIYYLGQVSGIQVSLSLLFNGICYSRLWQCCFYCRFNLLSFMISLVLKEKYKRNSLLLDFFYICYCSLWINQAFKITMILISLILEINQSTHTVQVKLWSTTTVNFFLTIKSTTSGFLKVDSRDSLGSFRGF